MHVEVDCRHATVSVAEHQLQHPGAAAAGAAFVVILGKFLQARGRVKTA